MKRITRLSSAILVFFLLFSFISCTNILASDSDSESNNQNQTNGKVTLKGTINVSALEGAMPSACINSSTGSSENGEERSASFSTLPTGYQYFAKATKRGTTTVVGTAADECVWMGSDSDKSFAMNLDYGTWDVVAGLCVAGSAPNPAPEQIIYISPEREINLPVGAPLIYTASFSARPRMTDDGEGTIRLTMTNSSNLKFATCRLLIGDSSAWTAAGFGTGDSLSKLSISDNVISLGNGASIKSGAYTVQIKFYDCLDYDASNPAKDAAATLANGKEILVYSTIQTINVFDNLETNYWTRTVNDTYSPVAATGGTFELTNLIVNNFNRTHIYVSSAANGGSDTNSGTAYQPYATLNKAISYIDSQGNTTTKQPFTITVNGNVSSSAVISTTTAAHASSITIEGKTGSSSDVLNGGGTNRVLEISSTVPVTLSKIKVTAGKASTGGGGIRVAGSDSSNKAKLYIQSGTLISGNQLSSNANGIGLYAEYADVEMNGGEISGNSNNTSTEIHGAVGLSHAKFTLNDGEITGNSVKHLGANLHVNNGSELYIKGGKITNGTITRTGGDANAAGIWVDGNSSVEMTAGEISGNRVTVTGDGKKASGAAIYIGGNCSFKMSGGKIENNAVSAPIVRGGAIFFGNGATFELSGSAVIPYGAKNESNVIEKAAGKNDIFLYKNSSDDTKTTIKITSSTLSGIDSDGKVAAITMSDCKRGSRFLSADNETYLNNNKNKFILTHNTTDDKGWERWNNTSDTIKYVTIDSPVYVSSVDSGTTDSTRKWCPDTASLNDAERNGLCTKPFKSLNDAIAYISDSTKDAYAGSGKPAEIIIDGTITGTQQEIADTFTSAMAASLTIKGYKASSTGTSEATIKRFDNPLSATAADDGSALKISSTVPVTIEDLIITNGKKSGDEGGGGICLTAGTLKLGDGVIVTGNRASKRGGGVAVASGAKLFMYGSSMIGDQIAATATSSTLNSSDTTGCANTAPTGGGIYSEGSVYIGYDGLTGDTPNKHDMAEGYGVCRNYASGSSASGGGIQSYNGTLWISSGSVSYNQTVNHGGGIYGVKTVTIEAPVTGTNKLVMYGNKAKVGGAICLYTGCTLTMSGGQIGGNTDAKQNTATDKGGALYQGSTFKVSGSAFIYPSTTATKNDVYLPKKHDSYISCVTAGSIGTGGNTSSQPMPITPELYKRGTEIVKADGVTVNNTLWSKFRLTQDDGDWTKLKKTENAGESTEKNYVAITADVFVAGASSTTVSGVTYGKGLTIAEGALGTKSKPFKFISEALGVFEDSTTPAVVTVVGTTSAVAQEIPDTFTTSKASALTLKGLSSSSPGIIKRYDTAPSTAASDGSALTVNSAVPVTIENITITGGKTSGNGGGINLTSGTVKLGSGATITGNIASDNGGGVYVGSSGTLYMYSSSLIGDSSTSTTIAADGSSPGSSTFANKAKLGGGIFNDGALYIGYSGMSGSDPVVSAMTVTANSTSGYGIRRNLAESGAGVYQNSTTTDVKVASGKISYNMATESGGAFYIAKKDTTKTKVTFVQNSTAAMDSNKASVSGGAVHIAGTFTVFSGNGHNNVAPQGGAIYLGQELNFGPYANFYDANNAKGVNDIYLEKSIWLSGKSNGGDVVASITMPDDKWIRGKGVLQSADALYTAASAGKFKATDSDFSVVQKTSSSVTAVLSADIYVAGTASTRKHCLSTATPTDSATTRGTASSPFASIKGAMYAVNADATTITVDGTLSDAQTIDGKRLDDSSIPTAVTAITVKGYKASSTATSSGMLDGGSNSSNKTMLTVNKSGLAVTVQDLTITRGNAANGGGIKLAAGTVNLESGAVVNSNKASSGGFGAGVYVASGATLNIKDGSAIFSNSENSGTITGAGVYNSGTVNMSGGSVYSNTAYNGGAFYNGGTLSMTGGAIGGSGTLNSATNLGGAIYQAGTFNVSGDAFVYSGTEKSNDVYLASEKYITISANDLSSTTVATITPSSWVRGMQVLYATTDSWITSNYGRFKVSDAEWNVGYYGTATADNAKRIGADLWVAGSGYASGVCATKTASDSNRGTKKQPYASIKKAAEQCWTTGKAFTINISGMITGATQEIPAANSTAGTTLASKITLTGLTGNTKDGINRNLAGSTAVDGGSALIINYQGYVDMTNLKIMGGNTTGNGGGIQINGPTTFSTTACPRVNLKSGVLIQQNQAVKGGGIYSSKAILCLSGTATVGNDGALDRSASNTAISNNINIATTAGGGIYNYNGYLYLGGAWVADAINTSGYNLTKGVYANVCSYSGTDDNSKNQAAGGIYNFGLFYMMNGNVSYNYGVNTGGVYSSTGTNAEFAMQGGKIHKNAGSGVYNAASSNFCMSGDAVIGDVDTVASSSTACSNNKGGLVNYGTARLGYSHGTTKAKLSGGIYGNYRSAGSGISHQSGTIYFDSGTIANNYNTGSGGGIYAKGAVYMTSSSSTQYSCITNNKAKNGGGIFLSGTSAKLFMSGYAIIGTSGKSAPPSSSTATGINYASTSGGGIYAESGPTIYLGYSKWSDGGTSDQATLNGGVCYNYATKSGGGIYCNAASSSYPITIYINSGSINANKVYYDSGDTTYGLGGGIYANSYTTIYMGGGQISKNSAMNYGGGVYTSGALFMYGSALIGDTNTSTTTTTESNYSNCAKAGGGVYVTGTSGTLALGYDGRTGTDYSEKNLTGGIKHNFATGETTSSTDLTTATPVGIGGGVYMTGSYFYMKSGTIGYNKAYDGAGLAITHSVQYPTVYDGGSITYNSARRNGGGVAVHANSYVLIKGSVTYNTAAMNGGGFYLTEGGSEEYGTSVYFEETSAAISNNTATSGNGGGVCSAGGSFSVSGGATMAGNYAGGNGGAVYGTRLQLNGVASIPGTSGHIGQTKYNDIYSSGITAIWLISSNLPAGTYFSDMYITLPSGLSSSDITNYRIVAYSYTAPDPGLASYSKFYLTQSSPYYTTKKIGEKGYLVNK